MNLCRVLTYLGIFVLFILIKSADVPYFVPESNTGFTIKKTALAYKMPGKTDVTMQMMLSNKITPNTIIFVGDVLLARNVEYLMDNYGSSYPYQGINFRALAINPYVVGNFESSMAEDHVQTKASSLRFSVSSVHLAALHQAGFTQVSLANNHSVDFGSAGQKFSKKNLSRVGIDVFGNPDKLSSSTLTYVTVKNQTIALIGLHTLISTPSKSELKDLFATADKNSDFQVVYIHWGQEYKSKNTLVQKTLAVELVNAGADLIIGHHPHVTQNIDMINGVPVLYSLGNYIFDQYFTKETQIGLMAQVVFEKPLKIHLIPVSSLGTLSQPHLMTAVNQKIFLTNLAEHSSPQLKFQIEQGVIILDSRVATSSKIAIIN